VITTEDAACPGRVDVGVSDHHLQCCEFSVTHISPPSVPVCSRVWHHLDLELFRSLLSTSRLCQPDDWPADDVDMAALYDRILPIHHFVCRQRPSDPWFDKDCHAAKHLTRRLERTYSAASRRATAAIKSTSSDATDAVAKADIAKEV